MRQAARDLLGRRLVVGRRAPDRRGDERITQCQPVVRVLRRGDVREAGAMERGHQEIARAADAVAGEHAAGAVGAVRRGRETDDQQTRAWDRRSRAPACAQYVSSRYARRFSRAIAAQY